MLKHDAIHEENILVEQAEIFGFQQAAGGGGGWTILTVFIFCYSFQGPVFREELQQTLSLPLNSEPTCPQLENSEFPFSEQLISVGSGNSE